jgi:hypothetical protein
MKTLFAAILIAFAIYHAKSQDTLTIGEVYEFEVGDVFHFSFWGYDPSNSYHSIRNIEIMEKFYSYGNDTLFYVNDIIYSEVGTGIPFQIHHFIDTIFYYDLNTLLPSIDSIYSNPNIYNGRVVNFDWDTTTMYVNSSEAYFVKGCGLAIENIYWEEGYSTNDLVYYSKSGEEWGTPHIVFGMDEMSDVGKSIQIFPNPASTFITITTPQGEPIEEAIIYNHLGQKVLTAKPVNNVLGISSLERGIYTREVITKEWKIKRKLIVQ